MFVFMIILDDTDVIHEDASYKHIHVPRHICTEDAHTSVCMYMHEHASSLGSGMGWLRSVGSTKL